LLGSENRLVSLKTNGEIQKLNDALEEENSQFEEVRICGICCERPREVIFLRCGHVYCCAKCSAELNLCPLDKKPINQKFKFKMCDKYGVNEKHLPNMAYT